MIRCIEDGYINREIEEASYRYQLDVEKGERIIVGVNEFTGANDEPVEILKINPKIEEIKRQNLKTLRGKRDNSRVASDLKTLQEKSIASENIMPYIVEAVRGYATIGEMTSALENVYSRYGRSALAAKG